jgi:transcriptional regulator with XRE-family HTH domain
MTREVIARGMPRRYRRGMSMSMSTNTSQRPVGTLLREWRERRRLSQFGLALDADVSARHLSFLETGKARPSREMVLRLADHLDVPLRERNALLLAAGFAPAFPDRPLDDPALRPALDAVSRVLAGHEPYPALAIDRHWTLVAANRSVSPLLVGVDPALVQPPVNVLRLSLHPQGLAPRIMNLGQWRAHLLHRLRRQIDLSGDEDLTRLFDELRAYPGARPGEPDHARGDPGIAVPLRLRTDGDRGDLSFLSTTMVFGTPIDVSLAELAIEAFFPADEATAAALRGLAEAGGAATPAVIARGGED